MLEIINFRNGEILTWRNGRETADSLEIEVRGLAVPQSQVTVNGIPANRSDRSFWVTIALKERINTITACARDKYGVHSEAIVLVWDKASFKRYATRIDDNSFWFTDLARERPRSLFDHFYFAGLKRLHGTYGSKFILKCFYRNDHDPLHTTMAQVPDCYKGEFTDNADWLRLAFHSYSEFPDRPYQLASEETLAHDFDLVKGEIIRFAGEDAYTAPSNVHWAMLPPRLFHVMRERGVKLLTSGGFMSNRIFQHGRVEEIKGACCDIGFFYEQDVARYMLEKRCFYDPDYDLFLSRTFFCFNIDTPGEIEEKIRHEDAVSGSDIVEIVGHEQYAYPHYEQFLPDYFQRIESACKTLTELGYSPVYFNDGIFGNPAWE